MSDLSHIVREALCKPASQPCTCLDDDKISRGCVGVCEDAVDRVVAALQRESADDPLLILRDLIAYCDDHNWGTIPEPGDILARAHAVLKLP